MDLLQNIAMPGLHDDISIKGFAGRVRAIRSAPGKKSGEFAQWVGIAVTTWSNYERETRRMDLDQAFLLCRATGVTLDWIYFGDPGGLPLHLAEEISRHTEQVA